MNDVKRQRSDKIYIYSYKIYDDYVIILSITLMFIDYSGLN